MTTWQQKIIFLTILMATMTGSLSGQVLILSPADEAVTALHHIAVTAVGPPGASSTLYVNETVVREGTFRIDGIHDFLNVEVPDGPVTFRVEVHGAGNRLFMAERKIHVLGQVRHILPYEADIQLPADGASTRTFRFMIQDEWGYPLTDIKLASVDLPAGKIIDNDLDVSAAGVQLPITEGDLRITIQAPARATRTTMTVTADGYHVQVPVRFTTPAEPFILVGSFSGIALNHGIDERMPSSLEPDFLNATGNRDMTCGNRTAFYASGGLGNQFHLTTSYDGDRRYVDQFFEDIDPDQQYPVYGDASTLEYDAQSNSPLFARLERNESYLLYGDYNTGMTVTEFSAYNRTFNGLLSRLGSGAIALTSFATLSDRQQVLDEIRGAGISGYYPLSKNRVTIYSEKIILETRDRYHPERVIKSRSQTRYHDYEIDYDAGTLMFKQPVPAIDALGNPVYIVISYEFQSGTPEVFIGGARLDGSFGKSGRYGTTMVMEERSPENYLLLGVDAVLPLAHWMSLKGELARSSTPTSGGKTSDAEACKLELLVKPNADWFLDSYYRIVDQNFVNSSQTRGASEIGTEKYGFAGEVKVFGTGQLSGEYYVQSFRQATTKRRENRVLTAAYRQQKGQTLRYRLAYERAIRESGRESTPGRLDELSELLIGTAEYNLTSKLAGTIERQQNLPSPASLRPNSTALGLSYALSPAVKLFGTFRITDDSRHRNATILGFESTVHENTRVHGKYEIGGAIGRDRSRASIGLQNKWQVRQDLTLNISYENTATIDSFEVPVPEHSALSMAFEYLPEKPWKTSGKYEFYHSPAEDMQSLTLRSSVKIAHRLSALFKGFHALTRYGSAGDGYQLRGEYVLGAAWRPDYSDALNWIGKIEYKTDKNTHVDPERRLDRMLLSVHGFWQPFSWLEAGGRIATRQVLDEEGSFYHDRLRTNLYSFRTQISPGLKWATILDLRYLDLPATAEGQVGAAAEVVYLVRTNLQAGIGYIFNQYEDADFAYQNYAVKNVYLTLHAKFSEDIFNWK